MKRKRNNLITQIRESIHDSPFWDAFFRTKEDGLFTMHLAILREPYLSFIEDGKKTVETRFAKTRCGPFEKVSAGDVLILKRAGGEIRGICHVDKAWFYSLTPSSLDLIREQFGEAICPADPSFWKERRSSIYASLMLVSHFAQINKLTIRKKDRRGWVVLPPPNEEELL